MRLNRIALILACGVLALVSIQSGVLVLARVEVAEAEARTVEVATRAAQVRVYEFQRGIFAMCMSVYRGNAQTCNGIVASSVDYKVYSDPKFSLGFEPPH